MLRNALLVIAALWLGVGLLAAYPLMAMLGLMVFVIGVRRGRNRERARRAR